MSVDVATFCSSLVFETSVSTGFGHCLVAKSLCDAVVCLFFFFLLILLCDWALRSFMGERLLRRQLYGSGSGRCCYYYSSDLRNEY